MAIKFTGDYVEWNGDKARRAYGPPHSPIFCPNKAIGTNDHVYAPSYLTDTTTSTLSRGYVYCHPIYLGYNGNSSMGGGGNSANTHWTWAGMGCNVTTTANGAIQMGLYSSAGFKPFQLLGLVQIGSSTSGQREATFSTPIDMPAAWYWVAVHARTGTTDPAIVDMGYTGSSSTFSAPTVGGHGRNGGGWYIGRYGHTLRFENTTTGANPNGSMPSQIFENTAYFSESKARSSMVSVMIASTAP